MPFDRRDCILSLGSDLKEYEVRRVMAHTAAAEADIRAGDKIIRFRRMAVYTYFTFRRNHPEFVKWEAEKDSFGNLRDGKKKKMKKSIVPKRYYINIVV